MSRYIKIIEEARLIKDVSTCTTTGDVEYPGTALEVSDENERELFHVVVDKSGERQVLIFSADEDYRLSLELLEKIIAKAKEEVRKTD